VSDDDLLAEQVAYYRARAGEYDRWFLRQGRFDRGSEATARWFAEVDEVRAVLAGVPIDDLDVLELAPGTGIWTEDLVRRAAHLTAVDASTEMLDRCRHRLGPAAAAVEFVLADLFDWSPARTWDAVVFCFWISHVPDELLDGFLAGVAAMLRPGGAVFFLDGAREPTSTAADHVLPDADEQVMLRRLEDGREFRIVKNFWPPAELEARCRAAGLDIAVGRTATYFQHGVGRRAG
jgi:demethylmenaquinone methyltransferase/2-methoxy-6-polyprenyl-1,4-benzoquinol methylase